MFRTRIESLAMRFITSDSWRSLRHLQGSFGRRISGARPQLHYFHQVDDPYSHLAAQKLKLLKKQYRLDFRFHLVPFPREEYQGDASRFCSWAVRDARSVAAFYGTELPDGVDRIDPDEAAIAASLLAPQRLDPDVGDLAVEVGDRLWQGGRVGPADPSAAMAAIKEGERLRESLGHYLSGTFYFEGEWYWGADRLCHLENRLTAMGLNAGGDICVPRPSPRPVSGNNAGQVTLEYFLSLRSPYTAISYARTLDLARRSGVIFKLKPVLPMMMRGVPAPRAKQLYIMTDAKREADMAGVPFGRVVDPFGEPVRRAFSLLPFIQDLGKEIEYCGIYLRAAWAEGIDITTDAGLKQVVERAGINWQEAKNHLGRPGWEPMLERNLEEMLAAGLWGVPSFRVTGGKDAAPFQCWGQDRLWRVETEISRRLG